MTKSRQKNNSATFQKSRELNCYLQSKMTECSAGLSNYTFNALIHTIFKENVSLFGLS